MENKYKYWVARDADGEIGFFFVKAKTFRIFLVFGMVLLDC